MAFSAGAILFGCLFLLGVLPASYQYRVAMLCLAFSPLLFSLAAYMASDRFYLRKVDLSEHGTSPKGTTP